MIDMKLNTRLKVSFAIMFLLPITLICAAVGTITTLQNADFESEYNTEAVGIVSQITPLQTLSKITNSIYEEMSSAAVETPDKFNNYEYLSTWAEKLSDRLSGLVVRRNDDIIYHSSSVDKDKISKILPGYMDADDNSEFGVYYGDDYQCLIKQIDFSDSYNNRFSVFIITASAQLIPQVKVLLTELVIAIIAIMIFTSLCLTMWMHHSIVKPLMALQQATQKIKEGNLDFELPVGDGEDEITRLTKDFEEMRVILKENAEEKLKSERDEKDLIRNISHDLKTPITTIKGYVEGLLDGVADTPEKRDKYIRTIYSKANDMDRLIDELTMYSRIDMNRVPYTFSRINVNSYMLDCCEDLSLELETKDIELEYHNYANEDQYVLIDPEQMRRVITNIISNSVKYLGKSKGVVRIEVFSDGEYALIRISDNGNGIEPDALQHVFERFYRADSSRNSKQGGSGIGLAIVKKIIEDHGGIIWAESKVGVGTTMNIKLKKDAG